MANQVPLSGATQAAGGYLIPPQYAEPLVQTILREQAVAQLARTMVLRGRQMIFTTYLGRPIVGFVDEAALKPITGASWGQVTVGIQELAAIVPFTNQLLEDAVYDPTLLVGQDVEAALAQKIDANALGLEGGVGITSQFATNLAATTQYVEYDGTRPDGLALAISQGMGLVEANGGNPDGVALSWTFRQVIREARQTAAGLGAAQPVYAGAQGAGAIATGALDPFQGLRAAFTTNLTNVASPAGAGKIIGIVGDWSNAIMLVRNDINVDRSAEATLNNGGTLIHLWQQNMQAMRYSVRVGFYANDLNRQFCAIVDAT